MKKAIMLGAGQIGRGFIGMELEKAGYHVLFADINDTIINDLRTRGEYTVRVVDTQCTETAVRNISAINFDSSDFPGCLADSNVTLICTAVGQTALAKVAPTLAKGIILRREAGICEPMNIIAAENAIGGTSQLKGHIYKYLDEETKNYSEALIGYPNCAVDRIIPPNTADINAGDVIVERYFEWDVEKSGIKAPLLPVTGMNLVDDLAAYLERKLFTLNGPNAVTACLGYIKGYTTINEALHDGEIYDLVWGMMEECSAMLQRRHGFSEEEMLGYRQKLMQRFLNPYIIDSVTRVAREPVRKLSPNDRLIAPMNYASEYKIQTPRYYKGIAAVLLYDNPDDEQSREMQLMLRQSGVRSVLSQICGIEPGGFSAAEIEAEYISLRSRFARK